MRRGKRKSGKGKDWNTFSHSFSEQKHYLKNKRYRNGPTLISRLIVMCLFWILFQSMAAANQDLGTTDAVVYDTSVIHLDQNWSHSERKEYQSLSDGGALIPYSWLLNLEAEDSTHHVLSGPELGLLRDEYAKVGSTALPIGFVKQTNGVMAGSNCAACHQQEIQYQGSKIRIDGGAALGLNLRDVLLRVFGALESTVQDKEKFLRFAARVNENIEDPAGGIGKLQESMVSFLKKLDTLKEKNPYGEKITHYGYGRTDAIGAGVNRTAGMISNANFVPADAPVSIPPLWDTGRWLWVEYNSAFLQPMARNVISALARGVIVKYSEDEAHGFVSSLEIENLYRQQQLVDKLTPPAYPQHLFGDVNSDRVARGKEIFVDKCADCHNVTPLSESVKSELISELEKSGQEMTPELTKTVKSHLDRFVETSVISLPDIGTDPIQARNTALVNIEMKGKGGVSDDLLPVTSFMEIITQKTMDEAYRNHKPVLTAEEILERDGYLPNKFRACPEGSGWQCQSLAGIDFSDTKLSDATLAKLDSVLYYRAPPLDGIWATAPYLHNGSVPNMYQLLLPEDQRDSLLLKTIDSNTPMFFVGNPEFDPVDMGFEWRSHKGLLEEKARLDTSLPGNSNAGHSGPRYGTNLSDTERYDLIEYLKTHQSNLY